MNKIKYLLVISLENGPRMDFRTVYHQMFCQIPVLTWWPSGLRRQTIFRSFGQKLGWGPGESNFFFFFSLFSMVHNVDMTQLYMVFKNMNETGPQM